MKRSYARDSTDATPPFLRRVINITGWYMWDILIRLVRKSLRSMKFIKQSFLPWDFTWRVSDCEELVGVTHTEEVKVSPVLTTATKVLFPNTISVRVFEVGEVLLGCSAF